MVMDAGGTYSAPPPVENDIYLCLQDRPAVLRHWLYAGGGELWKVLEALVDFYWTHLANVSEEGLRVREELTT